MNNKSNRAKKSITHNESRKVVKEMDLYKKLSKENISTKVVEGSHQVEGSSYKRGIGHGAVGFDRTQLLNWYFFGSIDG